MVNFNLEKIDSWFMVAILILGGILIAITMSTFGSIKDNCENKIIKDGLTSMLGLGTFFSMMAITYTICSIRMNCVNQLLHNNIYIGVILAISASMLSLSIVMMTKITENCGGDQLKQNLMILIILNSIAFIGTTIILILI
jgi:hypothetical protein